MPLPKRHPVLLSAICLCLVLAMNMTAYAYETPDPVRIGSLSVSMTYEENPVPGGMLMLYQVGEIFEEDGNYSFILTGGFAGSGVSLEDISSSALAESLVSYASSHGLAGITVEIGRDGKANVGGLTLGLYLVVQTRAADGYEATAPFLVSIPMNEEGSYLYDVDASPKISIEKEETPEPTQPTTPEPTEPTAPEPTAPEPTTPEPAEPTLPYTGQLNWPVPVLAAAGLCLLLIGWMLCLDKKEPPYEA